VIRISTEASGDISLPTWSVTCAEFVEAELYVTTTGENDTEFPESAGMVAGCPWRQGELAT